MQAPQTGKLLNNQGRNLSKNSLLGLTSLNQEVALFDYDNVLIQRNYIENEQVRIVSGGAYFLAEFVGKGMLTASIEGDNYLAPSSKIVLRTLRELSYNHIKGNLVIVRANSGDLLNFGLAVERAVNDNLRVKLLPISDDVDNVGVPKTCKRGLSGIILILKMAGAMSERQHSLTDIFKFCKKYSNNVVSTDIDYSLLSDNDGGNECTCNSKSAVHYGVKRMRSSLNLAQGLCVEALNHIVTIPQEDSNIEFDDYGEDGQHSKLLLKPEDNIVILLNNNGILNRNEEWLFAKEILDFLAGSSVQVHRFYVGNFMRCLERNNLNLTVMKVEDKEVLSYLDDPCSAPGWHKMNQGLIGPLSTDNVLNSKLKRKERLSPPIRGIKLDDNLANVLLFSTQFACDALISCEKQLNIIDAEKGDGDTGTRLKNAAEILLKRMKQDKLITSYPFTFFESLSKILESSLGGTIGCIYSILFEAAAKVFNEYSESTEITPSIWLNSFECAGEALKRYGNVEDGDGTMYDPIYAFTQTSRHEFEQGNNCMDSFGKGVKVAEETAQLTKKPKYRYPDSGAHAVGIWMRAVFEGVKLRCSFD
ncbi:unnamed protein product [Phaedon cochleariae]|uniref:Triokinase/FMN cyclase n=1 Tax=Phaedon cochleariae TaxID=80249 RepID=A0A9P0GP84_PHACE|nr:unnamed protein product [Phaedon cochleariae]